MRLKNVPDEVHRELKIMAVRQNVALNDLIIEILTQAAQKAEKSKK